MTAICVRHRGLMYRLLSFKQSGDWSLLVLWDRKSAEDPQRHTYRSGDITARQAAPLGDQKRLTYHTSGQVNYHDWVDVPPQFHEPPHALTKPHLLIGVSIADTAKLTPLSSEKIGNSFALDLADDVGDARFTFGLVAAPLTFESPPNTLIRIDYDVFSVFFVSLPPPYIPSGLERHTIHFAPKGPLESRAIQNLDSAMLAYHQTRIGHSELGIYPPNGDGVYHLFPTTVMARVPNVTITFSEPGYRIEVIHERARAMLIPFRIFRGEQRITKGDLRGLISSIVLDSELTS